MRSSHFSLGFSAIGPSNPGETRDKVDPKARATRGYRYCGVSTTPGGRSFLLLVFIHWLITILMDRDVLRPE